MKLIIWITSLISCFNFYTNTNLPKNNDYVSACRWTGGVLACGRNNILVKFVYDSYVNYWSKNRHSIDYMLMDYILDIGYEEIPTVKKIFRQNASHVFNTEAFTTALSKDKDTSIIARMVVMARAWSIVFMPASTPCVKPQ